MVNTADNHLARYLPLMCKLVKNIINGLPTNDKAAAINTYAITLAKK